MQAYGRTNGNRRNLVTWGQSVQVSVPTGTTQATNGQQLVYVDNVVPETFSIYVYALISPPVLLAAENINAQFTLSIGVGIARIVKSFSISFQNGTNLPVGTIGPALSYYGGVFTSQFYADAAFQFPVKQLNIDWQWNAGGIITARTLTMAATAAPMYKDLGQQTDEEAR